MEKMINEYLDKPLEVGTVLKEIYDDSTSFYLVGPYFVYTNDYHFPQTNYWPNHLLQKLLLL